MMKLEVREMSKNQNKNNTMLLVFNGNRTEFEKIQALFDSGELNQLLGTSVIEMGCIDTESLPVRLGKKLVNLRQWLEDLFEADWQPANLVLASAYRSIDSTEPPDRTEIGESETSIKQAKVIDLGIQLADCSVALVVTVKPEDEQTTNVHLRVYPMAQSHLPPNLSLRVIDDKEITFLEAQSRSADDYMQLQFTGKQGESFSVQVALGETSLTENFIL
jgi:Protein of unknown function (DUF1822)